MLNTHFKKELIDFLYARKHLELNKLSKLKEIKDFDSECSGLVHDEKKESIGHVIYIIDDIINKYLHASS